jgi:hypothetical protein
MENKYLIKEKCMSQQNLISLNIAAEDLQAVKDAINVLKTKLAPHLKTLSVNDRMEIPKMGDKTISFVLKALEYSVKNSELVPQFLDVEEFKKDVNAVQSLRELLQPISQIYDSLNDSMMLSGSEAYQAALIYYNAVKSASKSKIQNAESIYNDLSSRFPPKNIKKQNATTA